MNTDWIFVSIYIVDTLLLVLNLLDMLDNAQRIYLSLIFSLWIISSFIYIPPNLSHFWKQYIVYNWFTITFFIMFNLLVIINCCKMDINLVNKIILSIAGCLTGAPIILLSSILFK